MCNNAIIYMLAGKALRQLDSMGLKSCEQRKLGEEEMLLLAQAECAGYTRWNRRLDVRNQGPARGPGPEWPRSWG